MFLVLQAFPSFPTILTQFETQLERLISYIIIIQLFIFLVIHLTHTVHAHLNISLSVLQ